MKTPAFIKNIRAAVSSALAPVRAAVSSVLAPVRAAISSTLAPVQDFVGRQTAKFEAFKDRNPKFKRVWNVLTHPTTTRILGVLVAIAFAPLTSGFTLSFAVSTALSCAVIFSTTLFMGIQKWRLGRANARLKVVNALADRKNTIADFTRKLELNAQVHNLKNTRPELAALLAPKPTDPPKKKSSHVTLTWLQSLYYEGAISLGVMMGCFGVGGAAGFASALATGLSGFIGQTQSRLWVTQQVYDEHDARRHKSAVAGLGSLSSKEERAMLIQGEALIAALQAVEKDSKLSLPDVYDEKLAALQSSRDLIATPGLMRCLVDEFNPFKGETSQQEPEAGSHAGKAKKVPDHPLKPDHSPKAKQVGSKDHNQADL